ncbi:hypothetical protein NL676_038964 [Syzygium grande]|nr:hypothetical protein NL676_038964 [Syzygium grande]
MPATTATRRRSLWRGPKCSAEPGPNGSRRSARRLGLASHLRVSSFQRSRTEAAAVIREERSNSPSWEETTRESDESRGGAQVYTRQAMNGLKRPIFCPSSPIVARFYALRPPVTR